MLSHTSAGWDLSQLATLKIDEYGGHGQLPVSDANAKYFLYRHDLKENSSKLSVHLKVLQKMSSCMQLCYLTTLAVQFIILSVGNIAFLLEMYYV